MHKAKDTKKKKETKPAPIPAPKDTKPAHRVESAQPPVAQPQKPSPGNSVNDVIIAAINEFLMKQGFHNTAEMLHDEQVALAHRGRAEISSGEPLLLEAFDKGARELFFQRWEKLVPNNIRIRDEEAKKLEFYMHVYFLIYPIHPSLKKGAALDKNEVERFKLYLENKGSELSKTTEFLHFYALPYMAKPQENPGLKAIFSKDWPLEIRHKLQTFLKRALAQEELPLLLQMYHSHTKGVNASPSSQIPGRSIDSPGQTKAEMREYINQLENNNQELVGIIEQFNTKYNNLKKSFHILEKKEELAKLNLLDSQKKWSDFSKDLVSISKNLLTIIEGLTGSQKDNPFATNIENLRNKIVRYDQFLSTNLDDLVALSQDYSVFEKASIWNEEGQNEFSAISPAGTQLHKREGLLNYPVIDFVRVMERLEGPAPENYKRAILQALRWRVSKTYGINIRRAVIVSYSTNDILSLKSNHSEVLDALFVRGSVKLKESASRFINALASDYMGRGYLVTSRGFLELLITTMKKEAGDTSLRRNILGSLQKLSLRRALQILMIENDLIKWTINVLKKEAESMSDYSLEYATALLMNLSLRTAGKVKCEDEGHEILSVLTNLLEHDNAQVRTFVNGTLYSVLSRPRLKEEAMAMRLDEALQQLLEHSEDRLKKQIQYILNQLSMNEAENEDNTSDTNDDDNDVDDAEEDEEIGDDDEEEEHIDYPNGLYGEELLLKEFNINPIDGLKQSTMIQSKLEQTRNQSANNKSFVERAKNPVLRPATPSMLHNKEDNNLPEELRSRHKIARTPLTNASQVRGEFFKYPDYNDTSNVRLSQMEEDLSVSRPVLQIPKQNQRPKNEEKVNEEEYKLSLIHI
eukprot:TRINITY_DN1848_c0_g1_i5.p1 TRINITY_DN1848_c0_g1~~TRINITY_DN1848_c0_g1_i5.p1  ORF type:complete len:864 (+),score=199.42 TRINITY_DN1848_c0_g1_i5:102-2693(+)